MPLLQIDAKACTSCKEVKLFSEFYKLPPSQKSKDGLRWQCKKCHTNNKANKDPVKRKAYSNKHYKSRKEDNPALFMWKQAKHRAHYDYNQMEFTIKVEDIVLPLLCPYLTVPLVALDKQHGYSLDRVDSTKGYTPNNIQVISRLANIMKNNATKEQLIAFAKGVLVVHSKEVSDASTSN